MGVTAPIHFIDGKPHNTYNEPENKIIPAIKRYTAHCSSFQVYFIYNMPTATNAKAW